MHSHLFQWHCVPQEVLGKATKHSLKKHEETDNEILRQ